MSHTNLAVVEDRHALYLSLIARIHLADLSLEAAVDLLHDLVNTGEKLGEQVNRPFLQGLGHDGVVGVSAGLGGDVPCFLPGQALVIKKDPHKLRNRHGWMGII